jgi:hypothetical protein
VAGKPTPTRKAPKKAAAAKKSTNGSRPKKAAGGRPRVNA